MTHRAIGRNLRIGIVAGLAGGAAEVGWIALYAAIAGRDAGVVARAVAQTVGIGEQVSSGIAIHMALAASLGIALSLLLRPARNGLDTIGLYAAVTAALAAVWAVNFLFLLPMIGPQFVHIVPMGVSLVSKLLFGLAAAGLFKFMRPTARLAPQT